MEVITQNVDDLHERAGSTKIVHLHGELTQVRSCGNPSHIDYLGYDELHVGDICPDGFQLRPNIVWFGESVPLMEEAHLIASKADIMLVIGTSLNVYPAAGLIHSVPTDCKIILIDPDLTMKGFEGGRLSVINEKAAKGMTLVAEMLSKNN